MSKKIVVTVMLGMNRFSEKDTKHPFDMSHAKDFNTLWMPQITEEEKTCSTPIYEMTRTMDEFIKENNKENPEIMHLTKDDFMFIVGRGTIGDSSEEHLSEAILEARRVCGQQAYFMFYTKSFGTVDTLRALKIIEKEYNRFTANILFCIDGYATPISKASVSKIYKFENKRERRFNMPKNVRKAFAIVQRSEGFKGLKIGRFNHPYCRNFVIEKKDVPTGLKYNAYSDGYERELDVSHFNMEELVSSLKCFKYGGRTFTINELIKLHCRKYMQGRT